MSENLHVISAKRSIYFHMIAKLIKQRNEQSPYILPQSSMDWANKIDGDYIATFMWQQGDFTAVSMLKIQKTTERQLGIPNTVPCGSAYYARLTICWI